MLSFTQHIIIIGAVQGILLFVLLNLDSRATTANRLLGVFCLLLALYFLSPFIALNAELNAFSGLLGWGFFLPASFGALNFLYYRHAVTNTKLSWKDLWHLTPVLICYLLNLHWLTESTEYRLNLLQTFDPVPTGFKTSILIFYFQAFAYNGFSAWLIFRYQNKAQNTLANFNPDIFRWLWAFLTITLIIWSFKIIADFTSLKYLSRWADILIVVFIYSVAIAQWRNPKLFRVEQLQSKPTSSDSHDLYTSTHKSSPGSLDEGTREVLLKSTKEFMQQDKPFLDSQLTLSSLAESIGLSTHHLSEVLNQQEGKNFYQFVNQYRVSYLIEQLKKDKKAKILDLALASGFSSKSTFNAVFKQFTDQTPSQFRKSLTC
ncbi:helix-turn-helix domain-containing protein [Kangiella sp. HZ709]|uniref:helix-turn-helix domain-containing protein n=1 Tax=Kangiella sp. HZ709 TaxID=2666328 RepID=UPI0012B0486E|nr:helix-turn-helix domain-containing protein [Kangiella sp. HZ709]MRX27442.1 helix-turn-helix domain-containing protein [Kangiella sp. HZ709]